MQPRHKLAARRRSLGFSQESLAEAMGCGASAVARWEQGTATPKATMRGPLADALQVSVGELSLLLDGVKAISTWLGHLAALERDAAEIWSIEPAVLPGLLQTRAYAEGVEAAVTRFDTASELAMRVDVRLSRQEILARYPDPVRFRVIIDEAVLTRRVGTGEVMADQLAYLAEAATRPNIEVRIAPADVNLLTNVQSTSHVIFPFGADRAVALGCSEAFRRLVWHEGAAELSALIDVFERLVTSSAPPGESLELIDVARRRFV